MSAPEVGVTSNQPNGIAFSPRDNTKEHGAVWGEVVQAFIAGSTYCRTRSCLWDEDDLETY